MNLPTPDTPSSGLPNNHGLGRRANIGDVARAAGVSVATVSRAIRGLPNVAASTRARVLSVAADLNYRPDPAATRLAAGITKAVAVAVPDPSAWYFAQVVGGIDHELNAAGYDLLLSGIADEEQKRHFLDLNSPGGRRADAIALIDVALSHDEALFYTEARYRLTTVGFRTDGHSSVMIDNLLAARRATDHLTSLGHRRIGLVGMSVETRQRAGRRQIGSHLNPVVSLRRRGYLDACAAVGVEVDGSLELTLGHHSDDVRSEVAGLLVRPDRPTAVFAMCDEQAFGVILAARDLGIRIPEDLSVVGIDDHDQSEVVGLTTVRQHVKRQGHLAGQVLLESFGTTPIQDVKLPTELVVRSSTAPPA